jgi:hypothetical protein
LGNLFDELGLRFDLLGLGIKVEIFELLSKLFVKFYIALVFVQNVGFTPILKFLDFQAGEDTRFGRQADLRMEHLLGGLWLRLLKRRTNYVACGAWPILKCLDWLGFQRLA